MHVPDGFINAPVSAASGLISLGTIWAYIRNAKNLVADRLIALTGMMSALNQGVLGCGHCYVPGAYLAIPMDFNCAAVSRMELLMSRACQPRIDLALSAGVKRSLSNSSEICLVGASNKPNTLTIQFGIPRVGALW